MRELKIGDVVMCHCGCKRPCVITSQLNKSTWSGYCPIGEGKWTTATRLPATCEDYTGDKDKLWANYCAWVLTNA